MSKLRLSQQTRKVLSSLAMPLLQMHTSLLESGLTTKYDWLCESTRGRISKTTSKESELPQVKYKPQHVCYQLLQRLYYFRIEKKNTNTHDME